MNCVTLVGRLTRDPEVRWSTGDNSMCIARFSVAVDRRTKKDGGQTADFPNVKAFGKTAEIIEKYFKKGMKIGIVGRLETGKYQNKDGKDVYYTEVIAENIEFVESKSASQNNTETPVTDEKGFQNADDIPEELPFN